MRVYARACVWCRDCSHSCDVGFTPVPQGETLNGAQIAKMERRQELTDRLQTLTQEVHSPW
jgi:ferredoxin